VLVYNGYKNMISQELRVVDLLPISDDILDNVFDPSSSLTTEPDHPGEILDALIKKYVEFNFYYALVDSLAAEHSARMQAMDAANKNANEMVQDLTLQYNKARQEAITTELIEIISGMEALN
jgi:F-type H+-transporting ATPase subunit gamma